MWRQTSSLTNGKGGRQGERKEAEVERKRIIKDNKSEKSYYRQAYGGGGGGGGGEGEKVMANGEKEGEGKEREVTTKGRREYKNINSVLILEQK